ncbi:hypothetical protein PIB30_109238, partial [Stylosanthes scabra]|nr:hypothetical protein [Stylosanthes scabra]
LTSLHLFPCCCRLRLRRVVVAALHVTACAPIQQRPQRHRPAAASARRHNSPNSPARQHKHP